MSSLPLPLGPHRTLCMLSITTCLLNTLNSPMFPSQQLQELGNMISSISQWENQGLGRQAMDPGLEPEVWPHCLCFTVQKVKVFVAQSCPTLWDPMNRSLLGSSVHGILQARILKWVAIPFFRGSSWPRDWTWVSCITGRLFTTWPTREALSVHNYWHKQVLWRRAGLDSSYWLIADGWLLFLTV